MAGAHLLQTEDEAGQRRNVGGQVASGKGAVRVLAPDTDERLIALQNAVDTLIAETRLKLNQSAIAFDIDRRVPVVVYAAPGAGLASEVTLSGVLTAVETLEALLGQRATETTAAALLTEARRRPVYKVANASASVPAGLTFTTIAEVTPSVAFDVVGYGSDLSGVSTTTFRFRLVSGPDASPTILDHERVDAAANSWRPVRVSLPAGTRVAVQVAHGEATPQEFRATLNHAEAS